MMSSTQKKIESFFTKYTPVHYQKGEMILRAGDPPPGIFYIKSGYVRQYTISPRGDILILHMYKPGAFFPMTWTINETPNAYYFEAIAPVVIYRAPVEKVRVFLDKSPDALFSFTSRLLHGVSGLLVRMEQLVLANAYEKTVSFLLYLGESIGETKGDRVGISIPIAHREVASWIGTTRETASLQMEALKKRGIIDYHGKKILIRNLGLLEQELHQSRHA